MLTLFDGDQAYVSRGEHSEVSSEDTAADLLQLLFQFHGAQELNVVEARAASSVFPSLPPALPAPAWVAPRARDFPLLLRFSLDARRGALAVQRMQRLCMATFTSEQSTTAPFALDLYDVLYYRACAMPLTEAFEREVGEFLEQYRRARSEERQLASLLPLVRIAAGEEPPAFLRCFPDWSEIPSFQDPRLQREQESRAAELQETMQRQKRQDDYEATSKAVIAEIPQSIFLTQFLIDKLDLGDLDPQNPLDIKIDAICKAAAQTSLPTLEFDSNFLNDCLQPIY